MLADFTTEMPAVVQVWTLDELLAGLESTSLPVTVAVFVKHVPLVEGAVPSRVMVKLAPLASAPSEHWTVLPVIRQPPVGDVTLVTPAGTTSFTA